eukprot:352135-Chlamydomonas_euryale.AAC.2
MAELAACSTPARLLTLLAVLATPAGQLDNPHHCLHLLWKYASAVHLHTFWVSGQPATLVHLDAGQAPGLVTRA